MPCLNSGSWLHTLLMFILRYNDYISMFTNKYEMLRTFLNYSTWQNIMNMCLTKNLIIQHIKWPWIVYLFYYYSFFFLLCHFYHFKYLPIQTLVNILLTYCILFVYLEIQFNYHEAGSHYNVYHRTHI